MDFILCYVIETSKSIIKEIKGGQILLNEFREIQKDDPEEVTSLKLPLNTRFEAIHSYLKSLLVNKHN